MTRYIRKYLDLPSTRKTLGVDPATNFTLIFESLNTAFSKNLDHLRPTTTHIASLLEHGVRVLIYVGTYDWIANWVGNEAWTLELDWSGNLNGNFAKIPLREWTVDGKRAGMTRSRNGLTFATVEGAGHMVRGKF